MQKIEDTEVKGLTVQRLITTFVSILGIIIAIIFGYTSITARIDKLETSGKTRQTEIETLKLNQENIKMEQVRLKTIIDQKFKSDVKKTRKDTE